MFEIDKGCNVLSGFFSHKSKIYYSMADKEMTVIYNL